MSILALLLFASPVLVTCKAVDGDTLKCGRERVRLLGIDAPEMGKCQTGRKCVKGNAKASTAALRNLVTARQVQLERYGKDREQSKTGRGF